MGFLLQFTETEYVLHSKLKILAKIQLGVICTHMVDFCGPSHIQLPKISLYITYGGYYLYLQIIGSCYCTFAMSSTYLVTIYNIDIKILWIHYGNMYIESDLRNLKGFAWWYL